MQCEDQSSAGLLGGKWLLQKKITPDENYADHPLSYLNALCLEGSSSAYADNDFDFPTDKRHTDFQPD